MSVLGRKLANANTPAATEGDVSTPAPEVILRASPVTFHDPSETWMDHRFVLSPSRAENSRTLPGNHCQTTCYCHGSNPRSRR